MDPFHESVTAWIGDLKNGGDIATQRIWERYFEKLVRLASRQLGSAPRRMADEEDVAVSVFQCLCEGAASGRFDQLQDRDDLWKLLTAISSMKAVDQIRRQTAKKRGGTAVRGESLVAGWDGQRGGLDQLLHGDPSPEFLAIMDEQQRQLFLALPDGSQREVARLRLEGFRNDEIADRLGMSLRSVERKLKLVREVWTELMHQEGPADPT